MQWDKLKQEFQLLNKTEKISLSDGISSILKDRADLFLILTQEQQIAGNIGPAIIHYFTHFLSISPEGKALTKHSMYIVVSALRTICTLSISESKWSQQSMPPK